MSSKIPPDWFPAAISWLFLLLKLKDRVTVTRSWMTFMPSPIFTSVKPLIKNAVVEGSDMIAQLIPELNERWSLVRSLIVFVTTFGNHNSLNPLMCHWK